MTIPTTTPPEKLTINENDQRPASLYISSGEKSFVLYRQMVRSMSHTVSLNRGLVRSYTSIHFALSTTQCRLRMTAQPSRVFGSAESDFHVKLYSMHRQLNGELSVPARGSGMGVHTSSTEHAM